MPQPGSTHSPFRDGFAALWHEPALLPAELVWRWCFGFSALASGIISIGLFLDSLSISRSDEFLIQTLQPQLLEAAIRRILRGSLSRFALEQSVLVLGVTLLWSLAAAAGRAATLRRLVAMFSIDEEAQPMRWNFAPIFVLTLLRALWSLIAVAVALGSLLYGLVMMQNDHALRAALSLSFGVGLASLIGIVVNWCFGVAPLFCIRNGGDAMEAVERTFEFSDRHSGRLFLLGLGFLLLRLIWAGTMCFAFLSPLSLVTHIDGRWVALLMAVIALIYFAGADLLYLARLGAYASLAEDDTRPAEESVAHGWEPPPDVIPLRGLA